jgi:hypothetical protein
LKKFFLDEHLILTILNLIAILNSLHLSNFFPYQSFSFNQTHAPQIYNIFQGRRWRVGLWTLYFYYGRLLSLKLDFSYRKGYGVLGPFREVCWRVSRTKPSWLSSNRRCKKSKDYPNEDLTEFSYKPNMEYKSIIILLYFWLHNENHW